MSDVGAVVSIDGVSLKGDWHCDVVDYRLVQVAKPWAHAPGCACDVTQTYTCDRCGRRVGYCLGCSDNMPGACDFCWTPPKDDEDS